MTRDDIMHLVNETAPRYQSWGIEAHFQLFAQRLLQIEREACIAACEQVARLNSEQACLDGSAAAYECAAAIKDRDCMMNSDDPRAGTRTHASARGQ